MYVVFFFQAEDGIRDAQESRGLGDVYKRQRPSCPLLPVIAIRILGPLLCGDVLVPPAIVVSLACLLYTSDAADDLLCVDLGGRRIIKKKKKLLQHRQSVPQTYNQH